MLDSLLDVPEQGQQFVAASLSVLGRLLVAVLAAAAVWFAARVVQRVVRGLLSRTERGQQAIPLMMRVLQLFFVFLGLSLVFSIFDLPSASNALTGVAIATMLVLGVAANDLLANLMTWIVMPYSWPFKPGDHVEIGSQRGTVQGINAQHVVLATSDGAVVRVPNRHIFRETVVNHSALGKQRVRVRAPAPVGADLSELRASAEKAVASHPLRDPARDVEVHFGPWNPSTIEVEVSFWVDYRSEGELRQAQTEALARIKAAWAGSPPPG